MYENLTREEYAMYCKCVNPKFITHVIGETSPAMILSGSFRFNEANVGFRDYWWLMAKRLIEERS